ncbi:MAG: hypothetical protein IJX80_09245 [Clostridia bacterium]|nr:hypothetical protein [Clostridia bacterium]
MKGGILISKQTLPYTTAWAQYEAGKDYKRSIGLYETVRRNERFYRGDQWYGVRNDLPRPVFNLVRRVTDYLVAGVATGEISIRYTDNSLPFLTRESERLAVEAGIAALNGNAARRWKLNRMDTLVHRALLDAALTGDGVFYCWWDPDQIDGQLWHGDIRTDTVDSTSLFVADVNSSDLQSQDYVILSGRATVASLRREAQKAGCTEREVASITQDDEQNVQAGDLSATELPGEEKATYLLRFFRENGEVIFEKSTRSCLIRRIRTGLSLYPVAYFHWHDSKGCFHGSAPVSDMIANQKYINTAYAMAMKHMSDTAFSKIVYDKSRIPEWSNGVGEAIAAMGGGCVSDAISVVGVGEMQEGYLDLISNIIETTRALMGATEAALGDAAANNTSAILALQEASAIALSHVRAAFLRCIGELADIWADMLCTYYAPERHIITEDAAGNPVAQIADYSLLKRELLRATAEADSVGRYTPAATVAVLDKLLAGGHLTLEQYLNLLPDGVIENKRSLLKKISTKGV